MRSSITKRLALIAMIPATLFVMVAFASSAQAATAAAPSAATMQADIVTYTNKMRAANGCKAVVASPSLTKAAVGHSTWMARTGKFSHVGASNSSFAYRIKTAGYNRPLSENIAFGYRTGADTVKAWMASPGHRANLLNCTAKAVGVGVVFSANGTTYISQEFGY
ncbi:CAP domain-containing protein [Actinoplanes sp. LDG1-06]|uniref:CAP domain-containing protein n=1 Tax=Paractinoplanes ovalisporus TaxID=2810368 RepID=A0ABS2AEB8_9ACTN|nr:CAP domain-containing protein [Actinoplanes ovalisporus]MBM2617584.1 CAP domain-containing protein [Actinoplanes ovalisporus]